MCSLIVAIHEIECGYRGRGTAKRLLSDRDSSESSSSTARQVTDLNHAKYWPTMQVEELRVHERPTHTASGVIEDSPSQLDSGASDWLSMYSSWGHRSPAVYGVEWKRCGHGLIFFFFTIKLYLLN